MVLVLSRMLFSKKELDFRVDIEKGSCGEGDYHPERI